jgi:hypothetical protein
MGLSTDLSSMASIPYFLWDEPMTVADLKQKLALSSEEEKTRLLGKILREARDTDVWLFTSPEEVARKWTQLEPHLGRRRGFWTFLVNRWQDLGLIG